MFRRQLHIVFFALFVATASLAQSEVVNDDVKVVEVVGEKADPQDFHVTPMKYGPRPAIQPADILPVALPMLENGGQSNRPREMVTFDLLSRTTHYTPVSPTGNNSVRRTPSGAGGAIAGPSAMGQDKDFTSLYLVPDPTFGEYPKQVRLSMTFVNTMGQTIGASCSATMIDARHVLTAAHCIFMEKDRNGVPVNDWATSVQVDPGYNYGPSEMGSSFGVQLHTWTGWTQDFDYDYDVAVIDLDRPIGALSGWRSLGTHPDFSWFESGLWTRYTYPGRDHNNVPVYDGQQMYGHAGTFDHDEDPQIGFDRDMYKGTSGGGAIRNNTAWAVRSHASLGSTQTSWDTRVTNDMFDDILVWLNADRPSSVDLFAMDVQSSQLGAGSGFPIEGLSFLVHNYSTAAFNGTVNYTVVLSPDATVSTSDHYVTSGTANVNLGAQGSARVNVSSATAYVPAIPAGDYTLGVIITNSDINPGNNATQGDDARAFGVLCAAQAPPILANPDACHPCVPTDVVLAWGSVPGIGVTYEVKIGTSLDAGMTVYPTSNTQYLVTGLSQFTRYFWRVRAITACGAVGTWSPPRQFETVGTMAEVPKIYPGPEESCVDTTVDFAWDEIPGADSYRLRIYDTVGGSYLYVDAIGNTAPDVALESGIRYYWTIKPKDACGLFGDYGSRNFFTIEEAAPINPILDTPLADSCHGPDILFQTEAAANIIEHDFEVQTADGSPAYQNTGPGYQLWILSMPENDYRWRARVKTCTRDGGLWGAWTSWRYFSVDATAPTYSGPPTSSSHVTGEWSGIGLVNVEWPAASDACGVAAYWYSWDQSPTSTPDSTNSVAGYSDSLEGELPDGANNWFHLVAVDSVGNQSPPQHLGPFRIDTSPPSDPQPQGDIPTDEWTNTLAFQVTWPPAVDDGSGLAGYSIGWSNVAAYVLDPTIDTVGGVENRDPAPEGNNFFHIRAVDNFGNAGPQQTIRFLIDRTPPEVNLWFPQGQNSFQGGQWVYIDFMAFDDLSGASQWLTYGYHYSVNGGSSWYPADMLCNGGPTGCNAMLCCVDPNNARWRAPWVPEGSQMVFRLTVTDLAGNTTQDISDGEFFIQNASGAGDLPAVTDFALGGNAPNPFNPRTTIRFAVPKAAMVDLAIYNLQGRRLRTLLHEQREGPSWHEVDWDGKDDHGQTVASGVYLYRIQSEGFTDAKTMTMMK